MIFMIRASESARVNTFGPACRGCGWGKEQMNKLVQRIFVVMALLSCVALAAAQGGGGGGGGGQGRRGGQRGRGGNTEMSLAMRADVQKELAVTDDQKTKLTDLQTNQPRPNFGGGGGTPPTPEERAKMMADMRAQQHKALAGVLNDGQMKRLGELLLQRDGYNALTQPEVQKSLNFTDDQTSKVKDLATKQQEANAALRQNQDMTREERTAAQQKNAETMKAELQKILTSEQDAKFKEMQGKPFTFEAGN